MATRATAHGMHASSTHADGMDTCVKHVLHQEERWGRRALMLAGGGSPAGWPAAGDRLLRCNFAWLGGKVDRLDRLPRLWLFQNSFSSGFSAKVGFFHEVVWHDSGSSKNNRPCAPPTVVPVSCESAAPSRAPAALASSGPTLAMTSSVTPVVPLSSVSAWSRHNGK